MPRKKKGRALQRAPQPEREADLPFIEADGRGPAQSTNWIHFRAHADLTSRLDEARVRMGLRSRSETARVLLEMALGDDAANAVAKQAVYRMSAPMRRAVGKLMSKLVVSFESAVRELPDQILLEIDADGSADELAALVAQDEEPPARPG